MTTLDSTTVARGTTEAPQDAHPGSSSAKQHGHQAKVIEAVEDPAAAGVVELGAAACQRPLAGGGASHATGGEEDEAGRRLGAAAQAQLTRTVLQQHETGTSQVGAAMHCACLSASKHAGRRLALR